MSEYNLASESCRKCDCRVPVTEYTDWVTPDFKNGKKTILLCEFCMHTSEGISRIVGAPVDSEDRIKRQIWAAAACVFNYQKFGFLEDAEDIEDE